MSGPSPFSTWPDFVVPYDARARSLFFNFATCPWGGSSSLCPHKTPTFLLSLMGARSTLCIFPYTFGYLAAIKTICSPSQTSILACHVSLKRKTTIISLHTDRKSRSITFRRFIWSCSSSQFSAVMPCWPKDLIKSNASVLFSSWTTTGEFLDSFCIMYFFFIISRCQHFFVTIFRRSQTTVSLLIWRLR